MTQAEQFMRDTIRFLIENIKPHDLQESQHVQYALDWIDSEAEIFRLIKPATPPIHLVAYFPIIDPSCQRILLTEHKKAHLWLPAGGHVEPNEHPQNTVKREILEELGILGDFVYEEPFFISIAETQGDKDKHIDISLWYLLKGDSLNPLNYDEREFHSVRWFSIHELPLEKTDPHFKRFAQKLLNQKDDQDMAVFPKNL